MKRDLMNHVHPVVLIAPQVATDDTAIVSNIIDTKDYMGLVLILTLGTIAAAAVDATVLVEEANEADFSDGAEVEDDQLVGTEELAGFDQDADDACRKIGYIGYKRYVRVTVTPASNDAALPIAGTAVLGMAEIQPTSNPPA